MRSGSRLRDREAFLRAEQSLYGELEKVTLKDMMEQATHQRSRMKWLQNAEPARPEGYLPDWKFNVS